MARRTAPSFGSQTKPALNSPPNTPPTTREPVPPTFQTTTPYNPAFTDSLESRLLQPHPSTSTKRSQKAFAAANGIQVIPDNLKEDSLRNTKYTKRLREVDPESLPEIDENELPLRLDDERRVYASLIPGVKLTHPGGSIEGGPGSSPVFLKTSSEPSRQEDPNTYNNSTDEQHTTHQVPSYTNISQNPLEEQPDFIRNFIETRNIKTPAELHAQIEKEASVQLEELKNRMRERKDAREKNTKVEEKIQLLVAEREMERRVHERVREKKRDAGGEG